MLRPAISRRVLVLAVGAAAGVGIGVGAATAWNAWGASTPQAAHPLPAAAINLAPTAVTSTDPMTGPAATSSGLTLDQAKGVATQASPGTVVEADQDSESTGLVYDVTVQHADGTQTKVVVDATTGQVISVQNDDPNDGPNDPNDGPNDGH